MAIFPWFRFTTVRLAFTVFIQISDQPRISAHLKVEKVNKHPPSPPPSQTHISAHPHPTLTFRVFYRNLALLLLRVLLLAFTVLLHNKDTSLAENSENLISAHLE